MRRMKFVLVVFSLLLAGTVVPASAAPGPAAGEVSAQYWSDWESLGGYWQGPFILPGDLWSDTAPAGTRRCTTCTGHDRTADLGPEVSVLPVPGTMD